MLQYQTIESGTLQLLKRLSGISSLKNYKLVGGTSLALQIGHRTSVDLDILIDAEQEPMPRMLVDFDWEQAKGTIIEQVKKQFP